MEGDGTPRKLLSLESCILCNTTERRLHDLTHGKAVKEKYKEILQEFLGFKD
jgi:hypothetical protein